MVKVSKWIERAAMTTMYDLEILNDMLPAVMVALQAKA